MKLKFIEEKAMKVVMLVTTLLVFLFVGSILYTIVKNGWGAMNWEMISSLPGGGFYIGKEGGLLNAIVGSLYIVGASTVLGLAVSIPVVFYLNVYLKKNSKRGSFARLAYDVLFGIPSIVYGAFAFTIMIYLGLKTSLAGGIINAIDHSDFYPFDGRDCPGIAAGYAECFLFPGSYALRNDQSGCPADRSGYRYSYFVVYRPGDRRCCCGVVHCRVYG